MELNSKWNPKAPLSLERLKEIKSVNGAYLLSKAEKESLVEEVLSARLSQQQNIGANVIVTDVSWSNQESQ